jgi:hypothetical protein
MTAQSSDGKFFFDVETPLGFRVRTTPSYWNIITTLKHPFMRGKESQVRRALEYPDEIRQSRKDPMVFLFYMAVGSRRWTCVVAKRLGLEGFLITTYPTDSIKEGDRVWPK